MELRDDNKELLAKPSMQKALSIANKLFNENPELFKSNNNLSF